MHRVMAVMGRGRIPDVPFAVRVTTRVSGCRTRWPDIGRRWPDTGHSQSRSEQRRDVAGGTSLARGAPVRPRQVLPGQFYMLTRRCTQRQFLLRPDPVANAIIWYCLAEAAARFGIVVLLPVAMSNHIHVVRYDPNGRIIEFAEHFHKMTARSLNALRGRWENLWASEPPCLVTLVEPADVIDKLVYVATNPVNAHLVERAHQWPGVTGVVNLLS